MATGDENNDDDDLEKLFGQPFFFIVCVLKVYIDGVLLNRRSLVLRYYISNPLVRKSVDASLIQLWEAMAFWPSSDGLQMSIFGLVEAMVGSRSRLTSEKRIQHPNAIGWLEQKEVF